MIDATSGSTSTTSDAGASTAVGVSESSNPTTQDTSLASQGTAGTPTAENVQGANTSTDTDPFAFTDELPSVDELKAQAEQGIKYADALASFKGAFEPLKNELKDVRGKFATFESVADRFESPEQIQEVLSLHDGIIGWQKNAQTGELEPATETGAKYLSEKFPLHADYLAADLLNGLTQDNGRTISRMNLALEGIAKDPARRAEVLQILGAVEPSSISPQWQPTQEELDSLVSDPEKGATPQELAYQGEYKKVPFDKRQNLRLNDPEFIKEYLDDQKFKRETRERETRREQESTAQAQAREQYINQQANAAGDQHVLRLMNDALTTFHQSVVQQCNFIEPLDPANLPQGVTAEQAQTLNQQIVSANKAEAAQITATVINLLNEETRPFVAPLLKEIGVIDDKFLEQLDKVAQGFGDNARNYGHLTFRGQLQSNGNGYKPGQDVTTLNNEAQRNLKLLAHYANQVKGKLMERRSQFFSMKAQGHNSTLNSAQAVRPTPTGSPFDPTTATVPQSSRWPTKAEIDAQYG